jgi:hypothetical protein
VQISGEPIPVRRPERFHLNILAGGASGYANNSFYLPFLLWEPAWSFNKSRKPLRLRKYDVLYRSSGCLGWRDELASRIQQIIERNGYSFVVAGKCGDQSRRTNSEDDEQGWGSCGVCEEAKVVLAFENYTPGVEYLSEKPFLALEFGGVAAYCGNGQRLLRDLGTNVDKLIDVTGNVPEVAAERVLRLLQNHQELDRLSVSDAFGGKAFPDGGMSDVQRFCRAHPLLRAIAARGRARIYMGCTAPHFEKWGLEMMELGELQVEWSDGPAAADIIIDGLRW